MNTYQKLLLSPQWQKKRLEILSRDNFTCQFCKSQENTLHVHHLEYEYGKKPWDYSNNYLITICHECHELESYYKTEVTGILHDMRLMKIQNQTIYEALLEFVNSYRRQGQ